AQFSHFGGDFLLRGIVPERFKDVSIGRSIAAEDLPEDRKEESQITEIDGAPNKIVRLAEFQREKTSARFGHAQHVSNASIQIRQVAQAIADGQKVKAVSRERNFLGI